VTAHGAPGETAAARAVIASAAARLGDDLTMHVVPYWSATVDRRYGGFLLDDLEPHRVAVAGWLRRRARRLLGRRWGTTRPSPDEKHLVGQTRPIHALALAHRLGFDASGDALAAALAGREFLRDRLLDRRHGGFAWSADRRGRVVRPEKVLYGQAFAILALAELGRAAGRADLLDEALELSRHVLGRLHDDARGGWREHAAADFGPLSADDRAARGLVDRPGARSANANIHVLEALAELATATGDAGVRADLAEALEVCARFFPSDPAATRELVAADWTPLPGARGFRVGHLLEHAWIAARAHRALGRPVPGPAILAAVDHALCDFDRELGGFCVRRDGGREVKEWWVQAEGAMALAAAFRLGGQARHATALARILEWLTRAQRGVRGVWIAATDRAGRVTNPTLAGTWKAGYHEVRAAAVIARAFAAGPTAA